MSLNMRYYCLRRKDDRSQPKWNETKLVKASFDFQKNIATVEYDICRLEAAYELTGNRLESTVSIRNTTDAGMEFGVRVLALKTLVNYWNYQGEWFGTSWGFAAPGCMVGVFVQGDYEANTASPRPTRTDSLRFPSRTEGRGSETSCCGQQLPERSRNSPAPGPDGSLQGMPDLRQGRGEQF